MLGLSICSPLPDNKWVTENCEKTCSPWKTMFPVEAVFPIEIILDCHVLNTHVGVDQGGSYILKARKHLGMICSFSLLLQRVIKDG